MHLLPRLRTHLPKLYCILVEEVGVLLGNLLFWVVALIYETEYVFVIVCVLLGLLDPELLQVFECFWVVYVTD